MTNPVRCVGILVVISLAAPAGARAGQPTEEVRQSVERVLEIVRNPELRTPGKASEREQLLRDVSEEHFALTAMARRALGRHWKKRSEKEREEFTALFTELIEQTYMGHIRGYTDEKFLYPGEKIDGDFGVVNTVLVTKRNSRVRVDYRIIRASLVRKPPRTTTRPTTRPAPTWLVYDVSVEQISMVNNYRTQIRNITTRSTFPELVERLNKKVAELKAKAEATYEEYRKETEKKADQ